MLVLSCIQSCLNFACNYMYLRLLFSLKPKEVAKMRFLSVWIDQR